MHKNDVNKITYSDGSTYEGELKDGKPHGHGVLRSSDGKTLKVNGKMVRWMARELLACLMGTNMKVPLKTASPVAEVNSSVLILDHTMECSKRVNSMGMGGTDIMMVRFTMGMVA